MNVVVDANIIIDLALASRMEAFGEVPDMSFHLTDSVEHEVSYPKQAEMLKREVLKGTIARIRLDEMEDLIMYANLRGRNGEGECSCLALAYRKKWHIATNETKNKFMRIAKPLMEGRSILRTADILLQRIRNAAE